MQTLQTLPGQIMTTPLTVTSILRHALHNHPEAEIAWRDTDMSIGRYCYADMGKRVAQLAHALVDMGVRPGDRVGTLAWNNHRHLELYYATACIGAICHTVNPRLHPDQIEFILNDAEDVALFFDSTFAPLIDAVAERAPTVRQWVSLTDAKAVPDMRTSV